MTKTNNINFKAALLAIGLTIVMPIAALAYSPERQTYTIQRPANKITFNSITNNPNYGDERNFTLAKPASHTQAGGWSANQIDVTKDEEYLVRVYVHNNAAANLNLVAENTRVRVSLPNNTANEIRLGAFISANNASPREVYDHVTFKSNSAKFNISYIAGSARYYNNHNPSQGFNISDDLVTNRGALVGYTAMDGRVRGCYQYSGVLTFRVRVKVQKTTTTKFKIEKKVRKAGTTEWHDKITVNPGDQVEYRLMYHNIGQTTQNNVITKDFLPKGVEAVNNSLKLKNSTYPNWININNQLALLNGNGLKIGNYVAGANAYMIFRATVPKNEDLQVCGANIFRNRFIVYTQEGNLEDVADVVVYKTNCTPPPPQIPQKPGPKQPGNPGSLPTTGPAEIIIASIGVLLIATSVTYWYKSQQEMKKRSAFGNSIEMKIEPETEQNEPSDKK